MPQIADDKLLTINETAAYLGVHRRTIYTFIQQSRLPAPVRVGQRLRFRQSDLNAFFSEQGAPKDSASAYSADQDPLSWPPAQRRDFIERHGHKAYREQVKIASERRPPTAR